MHLCEIIHIYNYILYIYTYLFYIINLLLICLKIIQKQAFYYKEVWIFID